LIDRIAGRILRNFQSQKIQKELQDITCQIASSTTLAPFHLLLFNILRLSDKGFPVESAHFNTRDKERAIARLLDPFDGPENQTPNSQGFFSYPYPFIPSRKKFPFNFLVKLEDVPDLIPASVHKYFGIQ
jgi:hypothetical protein